MAVAKEVLTLLRTSCRNKMLNSLVARNRFWFRGSSLVDTDACEEGAEGRVETYKATNSR